METQGCTAESREFSESPESSETVRPQQGARGQFGQGLGEEEEWNGTPVFGAKLLDHSQ